LELSMCDRNKKARTENTTQNEKMKMLDQFWRDIQRCDNNLGRFTIGHNPCKIRRSTLVRLLEIMGLDQSSSILDVGSGHGQVCFTAKLQFNIKSIAGVEIDSYMHRYVVDNIPRLLSLSSASLVKPYDRYTAVDPLITDAVVRSGRSQPIARFLNADFTTLRKLPDASHVYCFDLEFPPAARASLAHLLSPQNFHWKVLATCRPIEQWAHSYDEISTTTAAAAAGNPWITNSITLVERVAVKYGANRSATFYVFKRM